MILNYLITSCDVPESWQFGLQDPATSIAEGMYSFNLFLTSIFFLIGILVLWIMSYILYNFNSNKNSVAKVFSHSSVLEFTWTIFPAVVLLFISIPSFSLLYSLDEIINPSVQIKIIGHQWYWTYEVSCTEVMSGSSYDSYMTNTEDLTVGAFRLLEVDNRLVVPLKRHIRLIITSADVLHSWAVPSFGIKVDACPGRLNQAALYVKREGVFYGQCSEICGVNHAFMPITVRCAGREEFYQWGFDRGTEVINKIFGLC